MAVTNKIISCLSGRALSGFILSLVLLMAGSGTAQAELPSMKIGRADPVSLTAANNYYGSSNTHTDVIQTDLAPEIKALARALNYDPDLIYAYVKNKIEITPLFGLQKGALGTYIDGHGTAFDQAQLMLHLAQASIGQSGSTITAANFVYGDITLTEAQFDAWFGITDAKLACNLLAYGGIPNNGVSDCVNAAGSVGTITMKHAWVRLTIGGNVYDFDPAYKIHNNFAGINLPTEMGYSRAGFLSATQGTAGAASGVNYVENVSPGGISTQLLGYSNNLLAELKTTYKDKTLEEIIGGSVILDEDIPVGGWRLSGGDGYTLSAGITADDVPDQFRTTFRVCARRIGATPSTPSTCDGSVPDVWGQSDTINSTFYVDEIYGRKLEITPTLNQNVMVNLDPGTFNARLKVDGRAISGVGIDALHTNTVNTQGRMGWILELEVDHPYADSSYMDRIVETKFDVLTTANIVHGWGYVSNNLMTKWAKEYGNDSPSGILLPLSCYPECEPYLANQQDNTKAKVGAAWLAQFSQMTDLAGKISGGRVLHHHTVGVSFAESRVAMDCNEQTGECHFTPGDQVLRLDLSTGVSTPHETDAKSNALVHTVAAAASSLEGSLFEQQLDSVDVASTSERFRWAEDNLPGAKYLLFLSADSGAVDSLILQQDYDPANCFGYYLTGVYGGGRIATYLDGDFDEVLAVNDEFLGPGYECGPSEVIKKGNIFDMTHASLQRGAAFMAIKKDAFGNVTEIAHVVTSRAGSYKGGGGANGNDNTEKFDPAKAADILKDEFEDRSVMHGVDLSSGGAAWSSGTVLSSGNGGFPYELALELKVQNGVVPPDSIDSTTRHWNYGNYSTQVIAGSMRSDATMSGSGMEGMGASHPWNAVGTIAALYAAYDIALDSTGLSNLVLLPFINEWWSDQLTNNVVSVSSPSGGYQFVKLPDGTYNAPAGSAATMSVTGSRFAERLSPNPYPDQTRRWNYGNVDLSVTTPQKDILFFDAVAYFTNSENAITSHKHVLKSVHNASGFGADFTYDIGTYYHGVRLSKVSNDFGRELNWIYNSGYQYQVDSVNDGNGHSVTFTSQGGREGFTTPDNEFYGFERAATPTGARPSHGFQLGKVFLPTDAANAALKYTYNEAWQVVTVKDAEAVLGNRNAYDFRIAEGFRGERIDPLGNSYSAWYGKHDTSGARSFGEFVDEIGRMVRTEFDAWGRVAARQYPENDRREFDYDDASNVTALRKVSKDGSITLSASATYNLTWNKPASVTDFLGNIIDITYGPSGGSAGQIIQARRPLVYNPDPAVMANERPTFDFAYNSSGLPIRAIDAEGMVTVTDYEASGNPIKTVADCGAPTATTTAGCAGGEMITTFSTFDAVGNQVSFTDPRGTAPVWVPYDPGNPEGRIWDPECSCWWGPPIPPTAAHWNYSDYTSFTRYDSMRRIDYTSTADPDGTGPDLRLITYHIYDAIGRQTRTRVYDPASNFLQATYKTYTVTGQEDLVYNPYDPADCTDADDPTTCTPYQGVTDKDYDDADRLLTVTDPEGRITKNIYDAAGQQLTIIRAFGTSLQQDYATYTYTQNGQQATVMDANRNRTDYTFGGFGRLVRTDFPSETAVDPLGTPVNSPDDTDYETFAYDYNGNLLVKRTRDNEYIKSSYDPLGRVLQKVVNETGPAPLISNQPGPACGAAAGEVCYQYDLVGRQKEAKYADNTYDITHDYDTAGRLIASNDNGRLLGYAYDPAGNRTEVHWPDAANTPAGQEDFSVSYFYDALNRVTAVTERDMDPAVGFIATYGYDRLTRRALLTYANDRTTEYLYEADSALDALKHWQGEPYSSAITAGYSFDYNLANQVASRTVSNTSFIYGYGDDRNETYEAQGDPTKAANGLNQYGVIRRGGMSRVLDYDGNGSLVIDGARTYVYDTENRLTCAADEALDEGFRTQALCEGSASYIATYGYDPLGRRAKKSGSGLATEVYLNDGVEEIADEDASGNLLRRYIHGPGVDEYLLMIAYDAGTGAETSREFYHADYAGSIIAMSDAATGAITDTYTYSAYGETGQEGPTGSPFRYTGRRLDAETGLYYYRARYYAPDIGRFLQTDPIGYGDGMNMYAYVGNDPVNATDPSGEAGEFTVETVKETLKEFKATLSSAGAAPTDVPSDPGAQANSAANVMAASLKDGGEFATVEGAEQAAAGVVGKVLKAGNLAKNVIVRAIGDAAVDVGLTIVEDGLSGDEVTLDNAVKDAVGSALPDSLDTALDLVDEIKDQVDNQKDQ